MATHFQSGDFSSGILFLSLQKFYQITQGK